MTVSLLCESCGYVLDGLPESGACPECGSPIYESTPENRRPGSAWQQYPSISSWFATAWATCRRPERTMHSLRIEARSARRLLGIYLALSSLCLVAVFAKLLGVNSRATAGAFAVYGAVFFAACMTVLRLLTWIEERGVRLFGKRRGWRVTREVALSVCAHASVGWLIGALLSLAVVLGNFSATWGAQATVPGRIVGLRYYLTWIPATVACMFVGLLIFETLVYIGIRQSRYANPPRTPGEREGAPSAG